MSKSNDAVSEIVEMLNKALMLEHAAYAQYLSHAELVDGQSAESIIARLKEIAEDEEKHQEKFRTLIGDYLDGTPTTAMAATTPANTIPDILTVNIKHEKVGIDFYKTILKRINDSKEELPYVFLMLEHEIRHVLIDENEHIAELRRLLAMSLKEVNALKPDPHMMVK